MELRCPRELALRLGAIAPLDIAAHKELKNAGHILVRDPESAEPVFWPWASEAMAISVRSS